jgi:hypothetical protein
MVFPLLITNVYFAWYNYLMPTSLNRALVVLAAFDYESLQLTLQSLDHTVDTNEKVVVILNGKRNFASERTERLARAWASNNLGNRFVVRPLNAGNVPYFGLTEILRDYEPLKEIEFICKIDDDIIPLKKGWLPNLAKAYQELAQKHSVGFVTSFLNNNCWGFLQALDLFGKRDEYEQMYNYSTYAGELLERKVAAKKIDTGLNGTILQYPYLAWWLHQWTSLNIPDFIAKTNNLGIQQIPDPTHYSIGCIYLKKDYWLSINHKKYDSTFDELLLHLDCRKNGLTKWAVMDEPMIHLFYRTHRSANHDLIDKIIPVLSQHFGDESFRDIERISPNHFDFLNEESIKEMDVRLSYVHRKISSFSFFKKWKRQNKIQKLLDAHNEEPTGQT